MWRKIITSKGYTCIYLDNSVSNIYTLRRKIRKNLISHAYTVKIKTRQNSHQYKIQKRKYQKLLSLYYLQSPTVPSSYITTSRGDGAVG